MKSPLLRFLLPLLLPICALAQRCSYEFTLTATGVTPSQDNRTTHCAGWQFSYNSTGFSALTIALQDAQDNGSGAPASWANFEGTVVTGTNPSTSTTSATLVATGYYPWIRVNLSAATGTGTIRVHVDGWVSTSLVGKRHSYFVDGAVSSSGNGLSWPTAWKTIGDITGLVPDDTVYFSGPRTYALPATWTPTGGTSGHPIKYRAGQETGHNGLVTFDGGNTADHWVTPASWTTFDGSYQGARHFTIANFVGNAEWVVFQSKHGLVMKYVTFPTGDPFSLNSSDQFEIAFCTMESGFDHAISISGPPTATGYGLNSIHHNTILLDQKNDFSGVGSDGVQNGNSLDFYDNVVQGVTVGSYPTGQHQDGIQTDGRYTRVFDNTFIDLANYAVFFEIFASTGDMQVFNNVIYMSDTRFAGGAQQGIAIGRSGGATGTVAFTNIVVANNTIANYGNVGISMTPGASSTWDSSDKAYNNGIYNSAGIQLDSNVANATNVITSTGGASIFTAYQAPTGTPFAYDLHLQAGDTIFKAQGTNLTSFAISGLTSDHDGVARPGSGAWNVGAY